MLAHPSQTQAQASAEVSDAGSSSLSELEDMPEDQQVSQQESEDDGMGDNDTEASTERIDPSPQKAQPFHVRQPSGLDLLGDAAAVEQLQEADAMADEEALDEMEDQDIDDIPVPDEVIEPALREARGIMPPESPRKRKRSSSLSDLDDDLEDDIPLAKKHSSPSRPDMKSLHVERMLESERHISAEETAHPDEQVGNDSSDEDESTPQDDHVIQPDFVQPARGEEEHLSDITPQPPDLNQDQEVEGQPEDKADVDETEPDAAKTEDEAHRKNLALDDLKPIENLFAILRDRLFDERLASLATEIASLQNPAALIKHPDFLARKACIDARRETKIRQAETELAYKAGALERKALADRAVSHGQYVQEVRDIREKNLEAMNCAFSTLQRERRQWKNRDPQYIYAFSSNRSTQIKHQQSYNKEVSLLSGIARYEGFPAAPDLSQARDNDREDDLRKMRTSRHQSALERPNLAPNTFPPTLTPSVSSLAQHPQLNGTPVPNSILTPQMKTRLIGGYIPKDTTCIYPPANPPSTVSAQGHPSLKFSSALSAQHVPVPTPERRQQSFAARIANEEMSGAENFLERNPWARMGSMPALSRTVSGAGWTGDTESPPERRRELEREDGTNDRADGVNGEREKPFIYQKERPRAVSGGGAIYDFDGGRPEDSRVTREENGMEIRGEDVRSPFERGERAFGGIDGVRSGVVGVGS